MAQRASTLIIPVENQFRELDGKLLLSCIAAERGFPVLIGSRAFVHLDVASMPRGVYLAKSMRSLSDRMFDILRKLGHEIIAFDEEALVRAPDPQYWDRRLSAGTVGRTGAILAWGEDDARTYREYPFYTGAPIHVTGNARVDMMRQEVRGFYADEVAGIRERFSPFLLVNTNFGWNNHYIPNFAQINNAGGDGDGFMTRLIAHRTAIFEHFKKMIPVLAKAFSEYTILVRPHPTERHDPWLEIAAGHANVKVVNEGNVIPWLIACEALVHNSCTTAVEAFVLDKSAVAYQPVRMEGFDQELPNMLSHRAYDDDELVGALRRIVDGNLCTHTDRERRSHLESHIAALDGPLACERIVRVIEQAGHADRQPPRPRLDRYLEGWLHTRGRAVVKAINMRRSGHRNSIDYHDHRFPGVDLAGLRRRVEGLGQRLGRFDGVRVRQRSRHIFEIDAA